MSAGTLAKIAYSGSMPNTLRLATLPSKPLLVVCDTGTSLYNLACEVTLFQAVLGADTPVD